VRQVEKVVEGLKISESNKEAVRKNIGALNQVHHRDTTTAILEDLGIKLGDDEMQGCSVLNTWR
jgi:hypothetical protein